MLKQIFLVKRADGVTHEELARHWQQVHLPGVVAHMRPDHYHVTFFEQGDDTPFDGMAALCFDDAERGRRVTGANTSEAVRRDGFVDLVQQPAIALECDEHVIVDGPRPQGTLKLTALVKAREGVDRDAVCAHWLDVHAPNVASSLESTDGGLRYTISLAKPPAGQPELVGVAELWYASDAAYRAHMEKATDDGFGRLAEGAAILMGHEIVGVP